MPRTALEVRAARMASRQNLIRRLIRRQHQDITYSRMALEAGENCDRGPAQLNVVEWRLGAATALVLTINGRRADDFS